MGKCRLTRVPINLVGKKSEVWGFSLEGGWATRHGTKLGSPQGPGREHRARLLGQLPGEAVSGAPSLCLNSPELCRPHARGAGKPGRVHL